MTLQQRTQALLDLVEQDRRARCSEVMAQAERQAAATLAQARAEARRRMREAFAEERSRASARVAAARAELQTRHRLHEQQQAAAWLAVGWQRLPPALRQRWMDAAARQQWAGAALHEATRVLAPGRWRIVHAPGWPAHEREALAAGLPTAPATTADFVEDAALAAGLRIVADGNVVDATLGGLLADHEAIGARLLGELGEAP